MLAEFGIQGSKQLTISMLEDILIKTETDVGGVCGMLSFGTNNWNNCEPKVLHITNAP